MPKRLSILLEVTTRFGTPHDVVEQFLESESEVHSLLMLYSDKLKSARETAVLFESHTRDMDGDVVYYPALRAIVKCFKPIRHVQPHWNLLTRPQLRNYYLCWNACVTTFWWFRGVLCHFQRILMILLFLESSKVHLQKNCCLVLTRYRCNTCGPWLVCVIPIFGVFHSRTFHKLKKKEGWMVRCFVEWSRLR